MRLYHISETPDIKEFIPKPSPRKKDVNLVWAISEDKLPNYLLPRDCPRVTFFPKQNSDPADIKRLIGCSDVTVVIAIEKKWIPIIKETVIYKYEFNSRDFTLEDEYAGYYVSEKTQKPISVTAIKNILDELLKYNIELRILPSLWKIREEVIKSSLGFSIIRMRNATPPEDGIENYFPLPKDII
jgi:hypothetical protein